MGFLDKLLGRGKDAAGDAGDMAGKKADAAGDAGDKAMDAAGDAGDKAAEMADDAKSRVTGSDETPSGPGQ
jgi:hypothetical protein